MDSSYRSGKTSLAWLLPARLDDTAFAESAAIPEGVGGGIAPEHGARWGAVCPAIALGVQLFALAGNVVVRTMEESYFVRWAQTTVL